MYASGPIKTFTALAFIGSVMLCSHAHAELVMNGNFTDATTGNASLSGWNTSDIGVAATPEANFLTCCGADGTGSNNLAQFGGGPSTNAGGWISQSLATVAGQSYTLTFLYGAFGDATTEPQSLSVAVGDLSTMVTATADANDFTKLFALETFTFLASDSTTLLTFTDTSEPNSNTDGLLESVSISDVPEPASLTLLGLGIASIYASRKRRAV